MTKYFLNLEKRNKSKLHIRKLIDSSGVEVTEPNFVLKHKGFHSDLYKRRAFKTEEECFKYLESINMPQLNEFNCNTCEGIITKPECWDALSSMKAQEMMVCLRNLYMLFRKVGQSGIESIFCGW